MGSPDWATSEVYKSSKTRKEEEESITQKLSEWTAQYTNLQLTHLPAPKIRWQKKDVKAYDFASFKQTLLFPMQKPNKIVI